MKPPVVIDHVDQKLRGHLDQLNKTLRKISFGASVPDPVNPGKVVIGNKEPDRNMDVWKLTGTAPAGANTAFTLNHGLGRIPSTIYGQHTDNGGLIYGDSTTWTTTQVTLKCTAASSKFVVVLG